MFFDELSPSGFERSELDVLLQAPLYTVIAILLVEEIDPVQFLQQLRNGARVLVQAQQQQARFGSLAASLVNQAGAQANIAQLQPDEMVAVREYELLELLQQFGTAAEGRRSAIALCAQVSSILTSKVPFYQAQAYCNWLLFTARSVADALWQKSSDMDEEQPQSYVDRVLVELQSALTITPG